jgi:hypothetical protein
VSRNNIAGSSIPKDLNQPSAPLLKLLIDAREAPDLAEVLLHGSRRYIDSKLDGTAERSVSDLLLRSYN